MNRQDSIQLFESIYPGFFELANIRELPENCICDEMILPLEGCMESAYEKELDGAISFGYFEGKQEELVAAVEKVDSGWVPYFDGKHRVYCGYLDGKNCQLLSCRGYGYAYCGRPENKGRWSRLCGNASRIS